MIRPPQRRGGRHKRQGQSWGLVIPVREAGFGPWGGPQNDKSPAKGRRADGFCRGGRV
jgi:hypothetical protein